MQAARLAIEQGDRAKGELLLLYIEVGKLNLAIDDPGRLMLGRQNAQFVWSALVAGLLTAKCAGAATEVARQRVVWLEAR